MVKQEGTIPLTQKQTYYIEDSHELKQSRLRNRLPSGIFWASAYKISKVRLMNILYIIRISVKYFFEKNRGITELHIELKI